MSETLQDGLDACSKALGEATPYAPAQLATLVKEPGLESGTFGCSLRHFLPPCPSDPQTLCAPHQLGVGGKI